MERVTRLPKPRAIFPEPASLFSSSWPLLPFIWGRDLRSNDHTFLNPPHCGFLSWSVSWFSFTHTPFLFFHSRLCLGLCLQEGKCGGAGLQRTQAFHFPFNPLLLEPHPSSHLGQCITYTHILFPLQGLSSQTAGRERGLGFSSLPPSTCLLLMAYMPNTGQGTSLPPTTSPSPNPAVAPGR